MQTINLTKFDKETFDDLKELIKKTSRAEWQRKVNPIYACTAPMEITIQLTSRCNLRCKHCFQWSDNGYYSRNKDLAELDATIVEKILRETHEQKSTLYIWGGEPLFHKDWDVIAGFIARDLRRTVISTNGLLLEKKLDSILKISSKLVTVVSLDGLREEHDASRGKGMFNDTISNVKLLVSLQKKGEYKGKITLNCTLSDHIVSKLFDFVEYCEGLGVDKLILGYPWHITEETSKNMDRYFKMNFSWLNCLKGRDKSSWYSFTHHLDPSLINPLHEQIDRLNSRRWNISVKFHPPIECDEIERIIRGKGRLIEQHCLGLSSRISIWANGNTSFCSNFPEFSIGDIYKQGIMEIWRSDKFNKVREIMNTKFMPVSCQRCRLLSFNPM